MASSLFRFVFIFIILLYTKEINTQDVHFTSDPANPVTISVSGGSTLHDWKVTCPDVEEYPMHLVLKRTGDNLIIESFTFKVKVETMEGGRGTAMNKKTVTALKGEENPFIIFTQMAPFHIAGATGSITSGETVSGNLIIAGIERKVAVNVNVTLQDEALIFSGAHPLKMSDFQIDPPSAMFGQIQTHDDINIEFEFRYRKTDQ